MDQNLPNRQAKLGTLVAFLQRAGHTVIAKGKKHVAADFERKLAQIS